MWVFSPCLSRYPGWPVGQEFGIGAQIYGMAQSQARTLAYVDVLWILVATTALLVPLPFLMQRAKRGAKAEMVH